MAAPTNSANVKISLANSEPSTHGTKRTSDRTPDFQWNGDTRPAGPRSA
jgi:hypothetical protein